MTMDKAELKMLTVQDLGADMEDNKEAAEIEVYRAEGGMVWLQKAAKVHQAVLQRVDRDLDKGEIKEDWGPLEIASYTKKVLMMANQGVSDVALQAQSHKLHQQGRVKGITMCVDMAKKVYDAEKTKLEQAIRVLEEEKKRLQKKMDEESKDEDPDPKKRPRTTKQAEDLKRRKAKKKSTKKKSDPKASTTKTRKTRGSRKTRSKSSDKK
jgi:hypothetical protein